MPFLLFLLAAPAFAGPSEPVLRARRGLAEVVAFQDQRADLFPRRPPEGTRLLSREAKEEVWRAWARFSDYLLALESRRGAGGELARLAVRRRADEFLTAYAAFLAQYRWAMEFIARAEQDPDLHKVLDEPVPELGLPGGAYARLKYRFLHLGRAAEFAAFEAVRASLGGAGGADLKAAVGEDAAAVWKTGAGKGESLTAKNGLKIAGSAVKGVWMPVQTGVAEWMGDTKVRRKDRTLVTPEAAGALASRLLPGDVLLERREWFLSNVGLPGFWPHAALYIGTSEERRRAFKDQATTDWVRSQGRADGDFEGLLRDRHPDAYERGQAGQEHGHPPRVLEAMSEGVSFTTLEHSAAADSVAALRPRLEQRDKAAAILRAYQYAGRPYDFDFDFRTDAAIVCSELVYKAYEPGAGRRGLNLPLVTVLGRPVSQPNDFARQFDEQFGTPAQQSDFVLFLDGQERMGAARDAGLDEFRRSWLRPKWHILVQEAGDGKDQAR